MDRTTNLLTVIGALIAIGVILMIGTPADPIWWKNAMGPMAWALCPYAVMWLMNNVIVEEHSQRDIVLLMTVIGMVGLEAIQLGMVAYSESQYTFAGALHNLPFTQFIIAAVGGVIAYLLPVVKPNLTK